METGKLDRRLVALLVVSVGTTLMIRYFTSGESAPAVVEPAQSAENAEKRLTRLRELAAMAPGREAMLKQAAAELQGRETGILQAETPAQAQAQLLDVIHKAAAQNGFDARGAEQLGEVRPLGTDYGQVSVTVTFTCGIEQLVNFLAALANQQELIATNDVHITGGSDKNKNVQVRLGLSGVVPRKLVPKRKGGAS